MASALIRVEMGYAMVSPSTVAGMDQQARYRRCGV